MPTFSSTRSSVRPILLAVAVIVGFLAGGGAFADDVTQIMEWRTLDNFDDQNTNQWTVRGSKFATDPFPIREYVAAWPDALYRGDTDTSGLSALGIRSQFDRQGYNTVEIIPPIPIEINEPVQSFYVWVWGGNYNYTMEIHLRDYQGIDYTIPLGSLKYNGWKQLSARVPASIPQGRSQLPSLKSLEVTKLVIWTLPGARVDDFFVYLDEFTALIDTFATPFDGDDLVDPDRIESMWGAN